ncbi:MAG TPA: aspartyl/asparaginyl beta-hydroxylase domain-containing protein [Allosphingosinicella sp.]|jgi:aspartyl/asparaginyl beta-hydroxylase (cupin superfamily)/DNA-binding SARP family transcriptional activator|uniref:aspartyl/asparaginyl beta-hydroxylase domain-containing protein n=1 Tax=Allosphingosinicella sp. TaxID=2823234 RepID=UPI002F279977
MTAPSQQLLAQAAEARRRGDATGAKRLLEELVAADPACAPAYNSLGLIALGGGDPTAAVDHLARAAQLSPQAPPVWLNLAEAHRSAGRFEDEIAALDRALAIEPYLLPALFKKGQALERLGRNTDAVRVYRAMLATVGDRTDLPAPVLQVLAHARERVEAADKARAGLLSGSLEQVVALFPQEDLSRVRAYADQLAGRRRVFQQQPTAGHFPYLPALEFFPRTHFPWMETLENATEAIRCELMAIWAEETGSRPYVRFDASVPANQWAALNHSPAWSAYFLWENGEPVQENLARCPATAAAARALPLLDIPGKAPTVMFSILKPRTRIPPHTGSSNVRATVHLPLVVPERCGFRVGSETREWRPGEAWVFDDTIEHEAWNDSNQPRAILILDVWNPLLSEPERAAVRAIG